MGPDMMGAGGVMEAMLGHTEDGPEHKGTGVDEPMEETLGGTEDRPEDNRTERVTMVEYMVQEAWMNWEQSLRKAHQHWCMAQVVTTFGWLLGPVHVGWGLVMFPARPKAVGQPKPGPIRPGQAGPKSRPEHGFGPA